MAKEEELKRCFVVGPIGGDDSEERIHADWLLEEIIEPVFEEHFKGFVVTRADKISEPGQIDAQVIEALLDYELVIADMTTLNPNAFYEIGIRHMVGEPIIHMHLEGEKIPFDVGSYRSIKFSRKRPRDLKEARAALEKAVAAAIKSGHKVDNPVTAARAKIEIRKSASSIERVLMDELQAVKAKMAELEARASFQIAGPLNLPERIKNAHEKPGLGLVRIELSVADTSLQARMEDLIGDVGLGSDLFPMSSTPVTREVDVPARMITNQLLRALKSAASTAGISVSVIDDKGGQLLKP